MSVMKELLIIGSKLSVGVVISSEEEKAALLAMEDSRARRSVRRTITFNEMSSSEDSSDDATSPIKPRLRRPSSKPTYHESSCSSPSDVEGKENRSKRLKSGSVRKGNKKENLTVSKTPIDKTYSRSSRTSTATSTVAPAYTIQESSQVLNQPETERTNNNDIKEPEDKSKIPKRKSDSVSNDWESSDEEEVEWEITKTPSGNSEVKKKSSSRLADKPTVSPIKLKKLDDSGRKIPPSSSLEQKSPVSNRCLRNRDEIKPPAMFVTTPSKSSNRLLNRGTPGTPKTPSLRRQVLESLTPKSARKRILNTPQKLVDSDDDYEGPKTPDSSKGRRSKSVSTPSTPCTPARVRRVGSGFLTPVLSSRVKGPSTPRSDIERARVQLHVSAVPSSLPCREAEFSNIYAFVSRKIEDAAGGCMYISGVPGTGKTATVHAVVRSLQQEALDGKLSEFDFVEVNGLRLTEPRQAYVRIWHALTDKKVSSEQALNLLCDRFSKKPKRSTVLLVDEVDYVCNRRQEVIYNILDWPTKRDSRLIVLAIANTMDLPERTLKGKVTSRMGLTRLVFQPYTFKQLLEIVTNRLEGLFSFHSDAIQLVARKVAAVSGDARRALDICRRATEVIKDGEVVTTSHVTQALNQIFTGTRVLAIKSCSLMEQMVLRALRDETQRTGVEETTVGQVYIHLVSICTLDGYPVPPVGQILTICTSLSRSGLIVAENARTDIYKKLILNVSSDDIHYALDC